MCLDERKTWTKVRIETVYKHWELQRKTVQLDPKDGDWKGFCFLEDLLLWGTACSQSHSWSMAEPGIELWSFRSQSFCLHYTRWLHIKLRGKDCKKKKTKKEERREREREERMEREKMKMKTNKGWWWWGFQDVIQTETDHQHEPMTFNIDLKYRYVYKYIYLESNAPISMSTSCAQIFIFPFSTKGTSDLGGNGQFWVRAGKGTRWVYSILLFQIERKCSKNEDMSRVQKSAQMGFH